MPIQKQLSAKTTQLVMAHIDGYNLYYGIRGIVGGGYKWLDLQGMVASFLKPNLVLHKVQYFTAITKSPPWLKGASRTVPKGVAIALRQTRSLLRTFPVEIETLSTKQSKLRCV